MCGIVGYVGSKEACPIIIKGLKRLEYRGYDSAGVSIGKDKNLNVFKQAGKVSDLENTIDISEVSGSIGIGHTRWATHGVPNEVNAHPHATDKVAVVHNGIIENFQVLRDELVAAGYKLASETDTEVVAHLITKFLDDGLLPEEATTAALKQLEGAFALGIIFAGEYDLMIAARQGSPLAVGYGDKESTATYITVGASYSLSDSVLGYAEYQMTDNTGSTTDTDQMALGLKYTF